MEVTAIRDGLMEYATAHVMPKMDSKGQFLLGIGLGMVSSRIETIVGSLTDNDIAKALGIIRDGKLDYDALYSAAMAQIKRQGKLVLDLPILGRFSFDEQDLRDLHSCIVKHGGGVN